MKNRFVYVFLDVGGNEVYCTRPDCFQNPMGVSRTEVRNEGSDVTCLLSFFPRAALEFAG